MRIINSVFFLFFLHCLTAQVSDNFDDGDITKDPTWLGEVNNFRVDDDKALRLNAPDAGQSFIYIPIIYADSFVFEINVKLEFSPSGSNFTKLYFMLDETDLATANGYSIQIGENGATDALRISKVVGGASSLIASGQEGAMSLDPAFAKIKLTYKNQGSVTLQADYDLNGVFEDSFTFFDNSIKIANARYFGIQCFYSATRKDKFVYDNFEIKEIQKDTKPPVLQKVEVANDKEIVLYFDEALEKTSANNPFNYEVIAFGKPAMAKLNDLAPTSVLLTFDQALLSGKEYTLMINGVKDLYNNVLSSTTAPFSFIDTPKKGDIIISEILFDPYVNQQDFVELYNVSDKSLDLKGLRIKNFSNNQEKVLASNYILKAKEYIAFTSDILSIKNTYLPVSSATILMNELPAFNNDIGNVSILLPDNTILDSFNYSNKYHLFIDDEKSEEGVSLEKIVLLPFNNERSNWHSSAKATKYATPGYANSNLLDMTAPKLLSFELFDQDKIILTFDDVLTKKSVEDIKNYFGNQNLGNPIFANFMGSKTNVVVIEFAQSFSANNEYELEIKRIKDKNDNEIIPLKISFGFGLSPEKGDLIISEILFNPYTNGFDFVEVYNTSDKNLQLQGTVIANGTNQQEKVIASYYILKPKTQVAVSIEIPAQQSIYSTPDTARFLENALPSFNADKGNVLLKNKLGVTLDSFDYNEDLHQLLFDKEDEKGVSLEKIQLTAFNNNRSNWHSSAKIGNYATPGYANSNAVTIKNTNETFFINKKTFSPNGDSKDDLLIIGYNTEGPGYVANIEIYSSEGYKVKNLAKNELLGTSGIITWDGTNDDGRIERVGIYILRGSIYNVTGEVKYFQNECVLADFID